MPRKLILYIAMSVDGFIAKTDGSIDFLSWQSESQELTETYNELIQSIDTLIMGRKTYTQLVDELSVGVWPYAGIKCFVVSSKEFKEDRNIQVINGDLVNFMQELKQKEGKDIWLVGGAQLVDAFVKADLIDEYHLAVIPVILGEGIPLFSKGSTQINLMLESSNRYNGVVLTRYIKNK